jgi:hypothetical protein
LISRLNAKITSINFLESITTLIRKAEKQHVEMAAQFYISNNGSGTLEQSIERSKTFSEELTLEKTSSLSHLHKISVDVSVSAKGKAGIPFVAEGEIETALSTGYGFESTSTSQDRQQQITKTERTFTINKKINIPPCTLYLVRTYINAVKNMPIEFETIMEVSGTRDGQPIKSAELKNLLPQGMQLVKELNDNSIITKTVGKMHASMGIDTAMNADSRRIEGCVA